MITTHYSKCLLIITFLLFSLVCFCHTVKLTSNPSKSLTFDKCYKDDNEVMPIEKLSLSVSDYIRSLTSGLNRFSINILRSLHNFESKDSSTGIVISPFSIWAALLVSYMGARGETSKELKAVLGLTNVPKYAAGITFQGVTLWNQSKRNTKDGNSKNGLYSMANRIFINDNLQLNECIKEHFGRDAQTMDFTKDPAKARRKINAWIENETNGKIKDLIPAGGITRWTTIVIANALYFHSKWQYQFDAAKTVSASFHVSPVESIQVPFMKLTANLMYGISETLKATILELPYSNQNFSMLIMLPDASQGIDSLIKELKPTHIDDILQNMFEDEISVEMPKFTAEHEFELAGPLYSMGVRNLFDPRFSDLSGFLAEDRKSANLTSNKNSIHDMSKKVTVNSVIHKVFVAVNEEGTEAAATTAMLMARSGRPAFPTRFVVDRPFLFMIRDKNTNIILFIGIVRRPSS